MSPRPRLAAGLPALFSVLLLASAPLAAQRGDSFDTRLRPPAEERALFHVPPGFEIQLVAAEPEIQKPMNFAFDSFGRLWVTGSVLYPWPAKRDALDQPIATFEKHWGDTNIAFRAASTPPEPPERGRDTIRVLSDFGPDGRARKVATFADGLNIPVGILPLPRAPGLSRRSPAEADAKGDSVLVFSIPAIWRMTDTDGDGRADVREKLYYGFGFRDTHGMSSSYWQWFDGWVYGTHGYANASEVTDRAGRVTKLTSGNTYRFRTDGSRFEVFVHGQTNPFGLAFDARGDLYTADSHSKPVYLLVPGGYYEGLNKEHDGLGFGPSITLDDHGSTAIAGIAHYSAAHFPREFRDNLFNGNPVTRRINRARLEWRGSTPAAARQPDFLTSDDPAFRPIQVKLGPDGALWVADFYNPIIGHYEVPLTHPARDNAHGRLWRIVWRGLDRSVPVPAVPNLAREKTADLVARLSDSNLVVRSIAANELVARADAKAAIPALMAAATHVIAGTDPNADGTALLALLMTLYRLGASNDALVQRALERAESGVAFGALRSLAARSELPAGAEAMLKPVFASTTPEYAARLAADVFRLHPQPWQPAILLALLAKTPTADTELNYALRVALKTHAMQADAVTLGEWAAGAPAAGRQPKPAGEPPALPDAATAERVAEVCLAVPTAGAAEFLLGHLERTKFAGARAGDHARQAVMHLPAEKFDAVVPLVSSLAKAPLAQRVAFAEGLASVASKPLRSLPEELTRWMREQLVAAIAHRDVATAYRAITAVKDLKFDGKLAPLRRVALERGFVERNRIAALRSLDPNTPETEEILIQVVGGRDSNAYRRTAAELLGNSPSSPAARAALLGALASASADLTLALATALAKSDAGAAELLDVAASGRIRPTMLRHRYVATALEKRPDALRERAAAITQSLPPEDARLDALIAQRVGLAGSHKADLARGGAAFTTHCASCHKLRDTGGTIGPNLDGLESRTVARLVEDILDPNRNVDPAFRVTTLTLRSGETKSGMNQREEAGRILMLDPATGQEIAVARSDVTEIALSPNSPMPATFEAAIPEADFLDLVDYLRRPAR